MKNKILLCGYVVISALFVVFSYGFVDKNLVLSQSPLYQTLQQYLSNIAYNHRPEATLIYLIFLVLFYVLYRQTYLSIKQKELKSRELILIITLTYAILLFAYSLVSYDIFNYMTTAKMLFTHHENPYVVMPVEIPNDPNLAFTRAANKLALYGPTWLLLTELPHLAGLGNVWLTTITFKLFVTIWLVGCLFLIYKVTHRWTDIAFLALNPLILIEIVVSGHNDIVMMVLAFGALVALQSKQLRERTWGWILLVLSIFVKGATAILAPLVLLRFDGQKLFRLAFWLLFAIFIIFTPIREELYPWYAIWFFVFAAVLPSDIGWFERGLTIAFSVGLELRALPYMYMGYYSWPGPELRTLVTVIPVVSYVLWLICSKKIPLWNGKKS